MAFDVRQARQRSWRMVLIAETERARATRLKGRGLSEKERSRLESVIILIHGLDRDAKRRHQDIDPP